MPEVPVVAPDGTPGTLPESKVPELLRSQGRVMSPEEAAQTKKAIQTDIEEHRRLTAGELAKEAGQRKIAGTIGAARGVGEAFGVPTDQAATEVAALFGKKDEAQSYLRGLQERYPVSSTLGETAGQVGGAVAGAELTGGAPAARAPTAFGRIAQGAGSAALRGGVENTIIGTTHDMNEAALGKPDAAGEKIYARMPKHFIVGAAAGGVIGGGFTAAGEAIAPVARALAPVADRQASAAIGRELGEKGEGAVAAGERVRGLVPNRGIPKSSAELVDTLTGEQNNLRRQAVEAYSARVGEAEAAQARAMGQLSIEEEAARKATAARGQRGIVAAEDAKSQGIFDAMAKGGEGVEGAELGIGRAKKVAEEGLYNAVAEQGQRVNAVMEHYGALRSTLDNELLASKQIMERIAEERAANAKAISELGKHADFDPVEEEALGIMGRKGDPTTHDAIADFFANNAYDFSANSPAVAARGSHLNEMAAQLNAAFKSAEENHLQILAARRTLEDQAAHDIAQIGRAADARIATFQRDAARGVSAAEAEVGRARKVGKAGVKTAEKEGARGVSAAEKAAEKEGAAFERGAAKERARIGKAQAAEIKAIPKASEETGIDPLLAKAHESAKRAAEQPFVSGNAGLGAVLSLAHGNPLGAVASLLSSIAAGRARAQGNYLAARTLRSLGEQLGKVDQAIRKGAMSVVGRTATTGALAAKRQADEVKPAKTKQPSFQDVATHVREAQASPVILQNRVQAVMGPWSKEAPQVYAAVYATAFRAQEFLASKLPAPQKDAHSLTPHLESPDVSESEQYDFMQYVKALDDPPAAILAAKDGDITDQQVEAIQAVYPTIYEQMRVEIGHQLKTLQKPVEYDRAIHVGTLLGVTTDEVLDPEFQSTLSAAYQEKSDQGAPLGSKARSAESKTGKSMMSTSERVERGEP